MPGRAPEPLRSLAGSLLVMGTLVYAPTSHAGCGTDMDCKGDRLCVEGSCVDPESVVPRSGPSERELSDAYIRYNRSRQSAATAWVIGGGAIAAGGAAVAWGFSDGGYGSIGLGAGAMALVALTGPVAATSGTQARLGLSLLGLDAPPLNRRQAAWRMFTSSMLFGLGSLAVGFFSQPASAALGGGAILLGTTSLVLFQVDAAECRRMLAAPTGVQTGATTPPKGLRIVGLTPSLSEANGTRRAALRLVGSW